MLTYLELYEDVLISVECLKSLLHVLQSCFVVSWVLSEIDEVQKGAID